MGSVAPASTPQIDSAAAVALQPEPATSAPVPGEGLRDAVLNALASAGQNVLVSMLENGDWQVNGGEVAIKVAASATVIDMSVSADAKRLIIATASGALGRPAKLKIVSGGVAQPATSSSRTPSNGGGRSRAEQEPVVRRMKEKFGAEIRTIIDYKERR
jgi:DNA polymerase-3 subunit gamma/tau